MSSRRSPSNVRVPWSRPTAGDPTNAPAWYVNMRSVEWLTDPPLRVGSRMAVVAHFLGRRLAYAYEVAEIVLDERLVLRTADGPFPMETTYVWESLGDGRTRMALRNRGTPTGFGNIAAPFLSAAMRGANCKDLARLKEILEARRPG